MELKEKIEALEQQMIALQSRIAALKEAEKIKPWVPECGERYCYLNALNEVVNTRRYKDLWHDGLVECLNAYQTKEEAEFWAERFKVFRELSLFALEKVHNSGEGEVVYTIQYRRYPGTCYIDPWGASVTSTVVFESEEMAQKAIDYVGEERLIKYWFRIESHGD